MQADFSSAVHKHKVAPEGKGAGRDLRSAWTGMWSLAAAIAVYFFTLCGRCDLFSGDH